MAVEAKMRVDGRDLQGVLDEARMLTVDLPADGPERGPPLVAGRFLSRRVRDELARRGVNYADTTGNIRIVLARPGLYISDSGADRDPAPERRGLQSLTGVAAARVVRALFDADPPVKVRELAERSGTSSGTVSRVFELLEREAIVERGDGGTIVGVDRTRLIERWTDDYSFTESNTMSLFLEPRGIERLLSRLPDAPFRYAVTGSLAARLVAEFADTKLAMVYVDDIDKAATELGLVTVESGGNVLLAEPLDPIVFENTGNATASPTQRLARSQPTCSRPPVAGRRRARNSCAPSPQARTMADVSPLYAATRCALLDALDALASEHDGLVLVGAQAIFLHTGDVDEAITTETKDADLALDPAALHANPLLETAMTSAAFTSISHTRSPARGSAGLDTRSICCCPRLSRDVPARAGRDASRRTTICPPAGCSASRARSWTTRRCASPH